MQNTSNNMWRCTILTLFFLLLSGCDSKGEAAAEFTLEVDTKDVIIANNGRGRFSIEIDKLKIKELDPKDKKYIDMSTEMDTILENNRCFLEGSYNTTWDTNFVLSSNAQIQAEKIFCEPRGILKEKNKIFDLRFSIQKPLSKFGNFHGVRISQDTKKAFLMGMKAVFGLLSDSERLESSDIQTFVIPIGSRLEFVGHSLPIETQSQTTPVQSTTVTDANSATIKCTIDEDFTTPTDSRLVALKLKNCSLDKIGSKVDKFFNLKLNTMLQTINMHQLSGASPQNCLLYGNSTLVQSESKLYIRAKAFACPKARTGSHSAENQNRVTKDPYIISDANEVISLIQRRWQENAQDVYKLPSDGNIYDSKDREGIRIKVKKAIRTKELVTNNVNNNNEIQVRIPNTNIDMNPVPYLNAHNKQDVLIKKGEEISIKLESIAEEKDESAK
jgi:hypothetical protein